MTRHAIAMAVCPQHESGAACGDDWLGATSPPQVVEPYFDTRMEGWVLSRYADVVAAFYSADLVPIGPSSKKKFVQVDEHSRLKMRAETTDALSSSSLRSWRKRMLNDARTLAAGFDGNHPVDLIKDYAEPLCLMLAVLVTRPETDDTERINTLASQVITAAAEPFDDELKVRSKAATEELRGFFLAGPEPLRDSGFVALSRTMVYLLGNAWFALLRHPQEWKRLNAQPVLVPRSVEELLRFAGLTRLLFRRAVADTTLGELRIRKGDRVILRVFAANRDADRFSDPHTFSVMRRDLSQISLGAGRNACVGAPLIRTVMIATTLALVERFPSAELLDPIEWRGGSGFSSPATLPILVDIHADSDAIPPS